MASIRSLGLALVALAALSIAACSLIDPTPPDPDTGLRVVAVAGPVCPVERVPPDPACAPRAVGGAELVIRDAGGAEVARARTDARGTAIVAVPAGAYVVEGQPVVGLMGTPSPVKAIVLDGAVTLVNLAYDTGIR